MGAEQQKATSVLTDVKIFDRVIVGITWADKILAGLPQKGDSLDYFIKLKTMSEAAAEDFRARIKAGTLKEDEKAELEEAACRVFERDHEGFLCIWHGNIKALLRECATTLAYTQLKHSSAKGKCHPGGRQTFQHGLHIDPLRPRFLRDGKPLKAADGQLDRVQHVSDKAGTRSVLGRYEFLDKVSLEFEISWMANGCFKLKHLQGLLKLAEKDGLGASRSQGFGTFIVNKFKPYIISKEKKTEEEEDDGEEAVAMPQ